MIRGHLLAALAVIPAIGVALCCAGGGTTFFSGDGGSTAYGSDCGNPSTLDVPGDLPPVNGLTAEQVGNAATIVRVGHELHVPPRGWVIAVATALQESTLRNLGDLGARNDHDSLGLFQQRPSQGWGTPQQILDPRYASRKFYEHLLAVPGWQSMPLTDAAQRVQRSAYPRAYAKHEPLATAVVDAVTGGAARAAANSDPEQLACAAGDTVSAGGWVAPVHGAIVSGYRTPSRPNHNGVDLAVPKGTRIRAAAAGTVVRVRCNASRGGAAYSCDQDGSPAVKGCGWYVDIEHADAVITRYCHQLRRPAVVVGQRVTAGQVIGVSGTSGHSSGPHLHFEVHLHGDRSNQGTTDPVPWMRQQGAPLGR